MEAAETNEHREQVWTEGQDWGNERMNDPIETQEMNSRQRIKNNKNWQGNLKRKTQGSNKNNFKFTNPNTKNQNHNMADTVSAVYLFIFFPSKNYMYVARFSCTAHHDFDED